MTTHHRSRVAALIGTALLFVAAGAQAGHITVTYDLAGSTVETTSPLGTFADPLTGTLTLVYVTATEFETPSVGFVKSGTQHISLSQPSPGLLTLTGTTDTSWGSAPSTLSGDTFTQTGGTTGDTTGFLHCYGSLCNLAGFTASVPLPQTQTGPITLPPLVFTSGNAGIGDFAGTGTTIVTSPATVTVVTKYTATEISRVFVPEPGALPMLMSGIAGLGVLAARNGRRHR